MELELSDFHIDDIQWGDQTLLAGGQLSLNLAEIQDQIKDLTRNITVAAELARPGESKRIVHVLDTMLPIEKVHDELRTFPGIDVPARLVGTGRTQRLRNVLVTIAGTLSSSGGDDPNRETPRRYDRYGRRRGAVLPWVGLFSSDSNAGRRSVDFKPGIRPGARTIGVRIARYLARSG